MSKRLEQRAWVWCVRMCVCVWPQLLTPCCSSVHVRYLFANSHTCILLLFLLLLCFAICRAWFRKFDLHISVLCVAMQGDDKNVAMKWWIEFIDRVFRVKNEKNPSIACWSGCSEKTKRSLPKTANCWSWSTHKCEAQSHPVPRITIARKHYGSLTIYFVCVCVVR